MVVGTSSYAWRIVLALSAMATNGTEPVSLDELGPLSALDEAPPTFEELTLGAPVYAPREPEAQAGDLQLLGALLPLRVRRLTSRSRARNDPQPRERVAPPDNRGPVAPAPLRG